MADEGAQGLGFSGRYVVARSRSVEGFQSSLRVVAVGPLGIGKRRQSRQGAAVRRYAGGGTGEGERCNRGSGASHRARLTDRGGCARPGRRMHRPATKKPRPRATRPGLLPKTVLGPLIALHRAVVWVIFGQFRSAVCCFVAVGMWATRLRCPSCPQRRCALTLWSGRHGPALLASRRDNSSGEACDG